MSTVYSGLRTIYHTCNHHEGCDETTEKLSFEFFSNELADKYRKKGWFIGCGMDIDYCPKHSPYNGEQKC